MRATPASKPGTADAAAFAAARGLCRALAGDFYSATSFLSREKRDAACAVVAFCGMVREALDVPAELLAGANALRHHPLATSPAPPATVPAGACGTCGPTGSLDARVAMLRERLGEIYSGRLELPRPEARSQPQHALHAFSVAVSRYGIPAGYFVDFANGLRDDQSVTRYATWASLERQCRSSAGSIALMLSAVFGVSHSGAGENAIRLGTAIRLTTILCDLRSCFDRGKLYLPLEDLARFRYSERDLARGVVNENLVELVRFEVARARRLYHEGAEGLCWVPDRGSRLAAAAAAATSYGWIEAIEREGYDVLTRRPTLTAGQKLRRLPLAWGLSRRRPGQRIHHSFAAAT